MVEEVQKYKAIRTMEILIEKKMICIPNLFVCQSVVDNEDDSVQALIYAITQELSWSGCSNEKTN